ncbi:MAG: HEAT repeat domain-containing protein [Planctomycetes bacterium]|nr:HEAT repeat domain-containing protein [Planctomycetota bacterium]
MGFIVRTRRFATTCILGLLATGTTLAQEYENAQVGEVVDRITALTREYLTTGDESKRDEAQQAMAELEALQPSKKDAFRATNEMNNRVLIALLSGRRGEEVRRILEALWRPEVPETSPQMLDDVRDKIEKLVFGDDGLLSSLGTDELFAQRILASDYKDLAVPFLLKILSKAYSEGNDKANLHIPRANLTLTAIGSAATAPLTVALDSEDEVLRREILRVLGQIKDPASMPFLAWHASEKEGDVIARENAATSLQALRSVYPQFAGATFNDLGNRYLERHQSVVAPFRTKPLLRVWSYTGGDEIDAAFGIRTVPSAIAPYEFAKDSFYRGLDKGENHDASMVGLSLAYAGTQATGRGFEDLAEQVDRSAVPMRLIDVRHLDMALGTALQNRWFGIAESLILTLGSAVDAGSAGSLTNLIGALGSSDRRVSYTSALALAYVFQAQGVPSQKVVERLKGAIEEHSVFVVQLLDANSERRMATAAALVATGAFHVRQHDTAQSAVLAIQGSSAGDAIIVFEGNYSLSMAQMLRAFGPSLKRCVVASTEERASELNDLYGPDASGASAGLADMIWAADVDLVGGLKETLADVRATGDRLKADLISRMAAEALSEVYPRGAGLEATTDSLIKVITNPDRPASVMLPSVKSLGRFGTADAVEALVALFTGTLTPADADDESGMALRLAAGRGLWRILDRSGSAGLTEDQVTAIAALLSSDELPLALEAATVLSHESLGADQRKAFLMETRQNIGT